MFALLLRSVSVAIALRLHCVCTAFALRLHCVCALFALCLHCVCTAFALRLHCVCEAFALLCAMFAIAQRLGWNCAAFAPYLIYICCVCFCAAFVRRVRAVFALRSRYDCALIVRCFCASPLCFVCALFTMRLCCDALRSLALCLRCVGVAAFASLLRRRRYCATIDFSIVQRVCCAVNSTAIVLRLRCVYAASTLRLRCVYAASSLRLRCLRYIRTSFAIANVLCCCVRPRLVCALFASLLC